MYSRKLWPLIGPSTTIGAVKPGTYTVSETKAPLGYILVPWTQTVTIDKFGSYSYTFVNPDSGNVALAAGTATVVGSVFSYLRRRHDHAWMLPFIILAALGIGMIGTLGWIFTTWLRIKNGYPLDGAWGQQVYPKNDQEALERVRLLSQENAQLRAELGSIKDRLASVEKIVVDDTHRLTSEIEALRGPTN